MILNITKRRMARRFQKKEPAAIVWIHNYYYAFVYKIVEKTIEYSPDMDDLVNLVFMKLLGAASRLGSLEKIKDFLYLAARTVCMNYMKREQMNGSEDVNHVYENPNPYDEEHWKIQTHFDYLMNEAASRLSYKQQLVLRLFYCDADDDEEASRELQLSERAATNKSTRALRELKLFTSKTNDYRFY